MEVSAEGIVAWLTAMTQDPLAIGLLLALATLASEDLALVAGSLMVGAEMLPLNITVISLVAGIMFGDLGLYGAGAWLRESRFVRKTLSPRRMRRLRRWLDGRETMVLFFSRFLPGMRLPTYLGFGYLRLSLLRFTVVMFVAGAVWVSGMVIFVSETQKLLASVSGPVGLIGGTAMAAFFILVAPRLARRACDAPDLDTPGPADHAAKDRNATH